MILLIGSETQELMEREGGREREREGEREGERAREEREGGRDIHNI